MTEPTFDALPVKRHHPAVKLLARAHTSDAGYDLFAAESVLIDPGQSVAVSAGVSISLAEGTVGMVCPRSGLAAKHHVTVLNAPGIIDAGYTGVVKVLLINHGRTTHAVEVGDRIAQLVITPILTPTITDVGDGELPVTERGAGGFGSTGV